MTEPTIGRIVRYRLTREDVKAINRRYINGVDHRNEHRANANGVQVHTGNQVARGDVVPLIVVKVWPDEYDSRRGVCRDYLVEDGENVNWSFPLSSYGINGQAILDGNDSLWITSAPQGDFNGAWNWPEYRT